MHALHGELDMWKMGNVRKYMPVTHKTFLVGTLAIAGIPGLAGFFSKDEVLWYAWTGPNGSPWLWAIGTLVAGMTAFYMTRMLLVTFYGDSRMDEHVEAHAHENSRVMTVPLVALAALSIVGGYVGIPANLQVGPLGALHDSIDIVRWLEPITGAHGEADHADGADAAEHATLVPGEARVLGTLDGDGAILAAGVMLTEPTAAATVLVAAEEGEDHTRLEWTLMLASVAVALTGIGLAYRTYGAGVSEEPLARFSGIHRTLWNKYWVDELYDALFVNRTKDLGSGLWLFDDAVVDGTVNGVAESTKQAANASTEFDNRVVDGSVNGVGNTFWAGSWIFRALQTGYVQNYALVIALGLFVLISAYMFL